MDAAGLKLVLQIAITAWMVAISVMDHRIGFIRNTWTAPVFVGVGLYRLVVNGIVQGQFLWMGVLLLTAWAVIFGLWGLHLLGGGDAKFLMAQFAIFPEMDFVMALAFILLIVTLPLLFLELWRQLRQRSVGDLLGTVWQRIIAFQFLPTEEDLRRRGRRYAWTYAVPGIIYTWFYWGGPGA